MYYIFSDKKTTKIYERDETLDVESEPELERPYLLTVIIPLVRLNKMKEYFITLNLN